MNDCFQQIEFDPESIGFKSLPTMSKHIVEAMLPGQHGEVHKISMHEGGIFDMYLHIRYKLAYLTYCICYICFRIGWRSTCGLLLD